MRERSVEHQRWSGGASTHQASPAVHLFERADHVLPGNDTREADGPSRGKELPMATPISSLSCTRGLIPALVLGVAIASGACAKPGPDAMPTPTDFGEGFVPTNQVIFDTNTTAADPPPAIS